MDEQIKGYRAGMEVAGALYWRGRIYEEEEHNFGQAVNYYRVLADTYVNYYYGELARKRLGVLNNQAAAAPAAVLGAGRQPGVSGVAGEVPEDEPHLLKARRAASTAPDYDSGAAARAEG